LTSHPKYGIILVIYIYIIYKRDINMKIYYTGTSIIFEDEYNHQCLKFYDTGICDIFNSPSISLSDVNTRIEIQDTKQFIAAIVGALKDE